MAKKIPQAHGGAMNRFEKGDVGNPNGRPRKWVSTLKGMGYKISEINDSLQNMLSMTEKELEDIAKSETMTALEVTVAKSLLNAMKKGSLFNVETLLSRVYGKPADVKQEAAKEFVESLKINSTDPTEASKEYQKMME